MEIYGDDRRGKGITVMKRLSSFCLTILLAAFVLLDIYDWGNYVFVGVSALIFVLNIIENGTIRLRLDAFFFVNILFIIYALITSLWAIQPADSVIMARTLSRIFICSYMVYISLSNEACIDMMTLMNAVIMSGYLVALYAIAFYGIDAMIVAGTSVSRRLDGYFANVNTIGMACALSCVMQANLIAMKRDSIWSIKTILIIPAMIVVTATQSRKALVLLIAGVLGAVVVKTQMRQVTFSKRIIKTVVGIVALILVGYVILQTDIFTGVSERMQRFVNSITGVGRADDSAIIRAAMRKVGWSYFWKHPIGGIGIANTHIAVAQNLGLDTYLHDNFVELLCGGGIIGFALYYMIYIWLFLQLWRFRNINRTQVGFFALWLILMLTTNYGLVTYSSKLQNFYLMIHCLNIIDLKQKAVEKCISGSTGKL